MVSLAGGKENMLKNISDSMEREEYLWATKMCDTLLCLDGEDCNVKKMKAECCLRLAELETSANGRHYYQVCAKELKI